MLTAQLPNYMPSGLATNFLTQDAIKKNLTISQLQAALRAIIHEGNMANGLLDDTGRSSGLHPMYLDLHKDNENKEDTAGLVGNTMADIFDWVGFCIPVCCLSIDSAQKDCHSQ